MDIATAVNSFAAGRSCVAGICSAEPLAGHAGALADGFCPFVSGDIKKRTDPSETLRGAKSVIVLGVGYPALMPGPGAPRPPDAGPCGLLSPLGYLNDYHAVLKKLLNGLAGTLREHMDFRHKILVDSGGLSERSFAARAGLAFIGRNGFAVSPVFGCGWNIGLMLTDIEIPAGKGENKYLENGCAEGCAACADACGCGDVSLCAAYLTQKEGALSGAEKKRIGTNLYGCGRCGAVCPHNRGPDGTGMKRVSLHFILSLDEEGFRTYFGHTAMSWRGLGILKRNALAVMGNL